jgi:hypothetical protein
MYSVEVAFCEIRVPMIEMMARRMRRVIVSFKERKKSSRIERYPLSSALALPFDSFIGSLPEKEKTSSGSCHPLTGRCVKVFEIVNITADLLSRKKG